MKKIIFLLIMAVVLTGIVPAVETAYSPLGSSSWAVLSEYGVDSLVVTSDTVSVDTPLLAEAQSIDRLSIDYERVWISIVAGLNDFKVDAGLFPDYYLRQ